MTKDDLRNAVAQEASAACPYCAWGCWCDADWSPEARLLRLEEEHSRLEVLLG